MKGGDGPGQAKLQYIVWLRGAILRTGTMLNGFFGIFRQPFAEAGQGNREKLLGFGAI